MTHSSATRIHAGGVSPANTLSGAPLLGNWARVRVGIAFSALLAVLAMGAVVAGTASAASKVTETFNSTGAEQSFVVPAGVTSVRVRAIGEAGEVGQIDSLDQGAAPGGAGAVVAGFLPVTPGETLYVEVAARGFNGGGEPGFDGGGGGGAASDVRTRSQGAEETLQSRLLVAAGGGGGGGTFDEGSGGRGGDAGSPGADGTTSQYGGCCGTSQSAGGGAGTLTGGGAGGERCGILTPWSGREGVFGIGGEGGEKGPLPLTGGGGGGGGYWGGGGGEGFCEFAGSDVGGGGGGGGSSYVSEEATSASFGLASLSTEPSLSITYATPSTATPESSTVVFPGTQPLSTVSAPQTITLTNTGGNPLAISSETFGDSNPMLSSDHPEDFLIDSSSCLGVVAFEASCQLKVRFAPQGTGTRTATLQIAGNMGAGPTTIALTGTGGVLPQGPQGEQGVKGNTGSQGPAGQVGETGKRGAVGPQGPVGRRGAQGPRGLTATYICHPRRRHGSYREACFVSVRSASASATKATLERSGVVYASGSFSTSVARGGGLRLVAKRGISRGRYTLVLTSSLNTTRQTVTVG